MGCVAVIAVADYVIQCRKPRWIVVGLFDHPAHVATAVLILLNLPRRGGGWTKGYLAGSLLPDLDHVPLALRAVHPSPGDPRPVTHCLLTVAPVATLNRGTAAGMLAHYARDLGVGTGVPLLWPATRRSIRMPYALYVAGCLLLARRATLVDGL
jgi:hypothetical protein